MSNIKIKVFPSIGYSSYEVTIQVPEWVKNLDDYVKEWGNEVLNNVDRYEYVDKGKWEKEGAIL